MVSGREASEGGVELCLVDDPPLRNGLSESGLDCDRGWRRYWSG